MRVRAGSHGILAAVSGGGGGGGGAVHTVECDMGRLGPLPDLYLDGRALRVSVEAHGPTKV